MFRVAPIETPPPLTTPLTPEAVVARLDTLARRGKLAEFRAASNGTLFELTAFGEPFDHTLDARATPHDVTTTITYSLRMKPKMPWIFAIIVAVSVWPGVWLTDSMLRTYWSGYDFITWMWYLPLTILPVPWMWKRMLSKSRLAAGTHAKELAERIRTEIGTAARA